MWLWQLLGGVAIATVVVAALHVVRTIDSAAADLRGAARRPSTWLVGVPALVLIFLVGAPYLYVQSLGNAPKPLSFADLALAPAGTTTVVEGAGGAPSSSAPAATATTRGFARSAAPTATTVAVSPVAGNWAVGRGTQARYRADDTVMGMKTEVVGSTSDVSGALKIVDTTITTARVVVNMRTVTCNCAHDNKYNDMLDTDVYPTSTFELTRPIVLASIPAEGHVIDVPVTGTFTIHGVTRPVTFSLAALRQAGRVAINGKIPVKLEDYNIDNPNNALGSVSNIFIEFLVAFDRAG